MIIFDLSCPKNHRFEGWFASGADFDAQKIKGLLSCPCCESHEIEKIPSAKIASGRSPTPDPRENLLALAQSAEDVGERFPEEARHIHHGAAPERAIRGKATLRETQELLDEGIAVSILPPPKSSLN